MDDKIDFTIIGRDGDNIFNLCFQPALKIDQSLIQSTICDEIGSYEENFTQKYMLCRISEIEDRFFKLVKAGEKYGYDTDTIIEKPDWVGSTVFETATQFSIKICTYILNRNIRVNNILTNFIYPLFTPWLGVDNWETMLKKGINPKVISDRVIIFSND